MQLEDASRRADAGLRKGFRIAQVRGGSQSNLGRRLSRDLKRSRTASGLDFAICGGLSDLYVRGLEAFRAFCDFELNGLAFLQAPVSGALDFALMDEDVALATCAADKAKSLCVVKPLHCSLFHKHVFLNRDVPWNAIWRSCEQEQARTGNKTRSNPTISFRLAPVGGACRDREKIAVAPNRSGWLVPPLVDGAEAVTQAAATPNATTFYFGFSSIRLA
jgi:hypothetical protein